MTPRTRFSIALLACACTVSTATAQPSHHHSQMTPQPRHHPHSAPRDDHSHHPASHAAHLPEAVPPLTEADRAAVYRGGAGHATHADAIVAFWLLDQLEWQTGDGDDALSWEASGWIGNDLHQVVWRSEGERSGGDTEAAELTLLWDHDLGPWWSLVAGARHDFKPEAAQTWGAIGLEGTPLYGVETELTVYLGEGGQTAARLEAEYDILLTNRLILQPTAEVSLHGRNDAARAIGSGLSTVEAGLRLRYEIRREFAPYIGVSWTRHYGNSADFVRAAGEEVETARLVIGLRAWY